jgi:hypothetical protein
MSTTKEPRRRAVAAVAEGESAARRAIVIGFAAAVLIVAGLGFAYKMTEFAATIVKQEVEGFGTVAVGIYLIGMLPIVFFTLWAVLTGRFRDIEAPKYRALEIHEELERGTARGEHG